MNENDILWAVLTSVSVIVFISGGWIAQRKIRLLNYAMAAGLVIYSADALQPIMPPLTAAGYLFRMLTWATQASLIAINLYAAWHQPWFSSRRRGAVCMNVILSLGLMACLSILALSPLIQEIPS